MTKGNFKLNITLLSLTIFLFTAQLAYSVAGIPPVIQTWNSITKAYSTEVAIEFYEEKLIIYEQSSNNSDTHFYILIKLGALYRIKADFSESLEYDLAAMKIAEATGSAQKLALAGNGLGIDYYRTEDFANAEKYFRQSIDFCKKEGDFQLLANSYYKLAMVLDDTGRQDDAMSYFYLALEIFDKDQDCMGSADVYNGIAALFYKKSMPDSTEFYALRAMENYKNCGSLETVSFMYMNLASLKNMQNQHLKALDYLNKGLQIADSLDFLSQLRQGYKNLSETYSYLGDYENAYKNQLKYIVYKDSIFNSENSAKFLELNTKYETEKKERELAEQQAKIEVQNSKIQRSETQRNLLIIIVALAIGIAVILIYRFNEKKKYAALLDSKNSELEKINASKDKLFSIISHDLSSPVASYSRLTEALMNSVDKLTQVALKEYLRELNSSSKNIQSLLANLLQWSLQQSGHFTPNPQLLKLNEVCNSVIKTLSAVADEKEIRISFDCESEINIFADKKMIETALRNIISNAIKFSPKNSEVVFSTLIQSNWATIKITDSGPGLDEEEIKKLFIPGEDLTLIGGKNKNKGTGLGLILAGEFVRMNNGEIFAEQNPGKSGLTITIKLKAS